MKTPQITLARARQILETATRSEVAVIGDIMLDQFIWGTVGRISPEAPVPVVDFKQENFMPGGAANVARNLTALNIPTELLGVTGQDASGEELRRLLRDCGIGCKGVVPDAKRLTSLKTRIVAHQQQVVRIDRESRTGVDSGITAELLRTVKKSGKTQAVIIGDYGKGVVTQELLDGLRSYCRENGIWLSLDPKPVHRLDLRGLSLITPNRKEAFELAGIADETRGNNHPLEDAGLLKVSSKLLEELGPAILLITLGELGMLLCQRNEKPVHIPTVAKEVFDVSGAGDTVIATFTLAITGGASPLEAAMLSNYAAGVVVGKVGTATVSTDELLDSLR